MTSALTSPKSSILPGGGRLSVPDGFRYTYIDESPATFTNEGLIKEKAYLLHDIAKTTNNLPRILNSGRLALLKFKDGHAIGVILHPKLELISDISKFIFCFNNETEAYLLQEKIGIARSTEDQYQKIATKLLKV